MNRLSFARLLAVFIKEFQQMLRDRLTFAMAVGIPVLQLVLFGYAINTDPKDLPTAVVAHDDSGPFTRSLVAALQNTGYFRVAHRDRERGAGRRADGAGRRCSSSSSSRRDFSRRLVRGERPALLVAVDATDPQRLGQRHRRAGPGGAAGAGARPAGAAARACSADATPYEVRIHRRYNPEGLSRYNIVPGLIGTILTMTMVMLTGLAMTRERERGTMENLLATPVRPLEVMLGKIAPYVVIGYVQLGVILVAAWLLFEVPMVGSLPLLLALIGVFIVANLAVGFTFSTFARNQLQAMQMTFFFFLPSILLSGFMFPFRGMPQWAQWIGELLPLTHFLRIVRGILLKGNGIIELLPELWPMLAFAGVAGALALWRYRQTLD